MKPITKSIIWLLMGLFIGNLIFFYVISIEVDVVELVFVDFCIIMGYLVRLGHELIGEKQPKSLGYTTQDTEKEMPATPNTILKDIKEASDPLIKYLNDNHHPHVTAIVTTSSVELLEGIASAPNIFDHVKD